MVEHGGFDNIDTRPKRFDASVDIQGVGEAMNVIKFMKTYKKPVLAILDTMTQSGDSRIDTLHRKKILNKERRSAAMLVAFNSSWDELAQCICEDYPITV